MRIRELILISDSSIQFWMSEIELHVKINREIKSFLKWKFENILEFGENLHDILSGGERIRLALERYAEHDLRLWRGGLKLRAIIDAERRKTNWTTFQHANLILFQIISPLCLVQIQTGVVITAFIRYSDRPQLYTSRQKLYGPQFAGFSTQMNLTQILIAEWNQLWKLFRMIPKSPTSSRIFRLKIDFLTFAWAKLWEATWLDKTLWHLVENWPIFHENNG